ncbi:helix-turn-helix transcriptional regulator [Zophobihabitans entericus]|uniref:YafY family transcriptional regulator n=1 Tax=Zophobihabitans entericus TaxID=1635327 RepID=A0A6G9ICW6_9GAMM|nr:YafY family protein [Zophobihabitans entericus]QIQ21659.1 YafY family transcriptional regulator [Zophobihabitans entericus]
MRRADRLFQIIQFLRTRRLTTAKWLAEKLEISERTVYRDIQDLMSTGVPIDGEAGVGYVLRKDYDLPPLMFDLDELTTLVLGARMVAALGGKMKTNADRALSKLNSALPKKLQEDINKIKLYAPSFNRLHYGAMIDLINQAIIQHQVISIDYQKPQDVVAERRKIYPLGVFFWSDRWTMVGWCTTRNDFRHFRLDRILEYTLLDETFKLEKEQRLETYLASVIV